MQWLRLRTVFPWRIALLMSMVPAMALAMFMGWFKWGLQPLERYYLMAYWESSEGAKQPGSTTQIQWLFKAAPGRKSEPVIGVDVASGGPANLSIELSPSVHERGWIELEKSRPETVNSAELADFLQEDFYGNRSFRQVIAEPLLSVCIVPVVVLYIAFMMRQELGAEWRRLYEEVSESEWVLNLSEDWDQFARRIRSWIGQQIVIEKARLQRGYSAIKTSAHSAIIPNMVRQAESSTLRDEKRYPPSSPKEPPQRRSIFPGAASVRNANEQSKPWDESQWID
jgi:hypothetical protein